MLVRNGAQSGVDFLATRHRGEVPTAGGGEGADGGALINSFLEAAAGKESSEVAGGEAVAGADRVDRRDGKVARPRRLSVGGPGPGSLGS
jgi:hypothetical protein